MKSISSNTIKQVFILFLIIMMGMLIFNELLPYLSGVLGAITIYVLMRKWMEKLVNKGWNPSLAASLLMILSFVGILIPMVGVISMLGNKIGNAVQNSEKVFTALKNQISIWETQYGYDLNSQIDVSAISSWITEKIQGFAGNTFDIFISIAIMYFMLFYMLTSHKLQKNSLLNYLPLSSENLKIISNEVSKMVRSNALGIPLVAVAQGIIALIGFLIFGVEDPFFWFAIVAVGSMIPFVGTLVGILPVFIISLSTGQNFQAWGILLYGIIVVGSADNIIRLFVLKKLDNVHPLITLLGVIIGVPIFGFIGLIFGPLLISLFFIVLRIYNKEYGESKSLT
ncbi:MAG: putative PurR-regulated permease PerM [Flavobacteriaceae bacterium]|jgi:predicted PurR-regulated permease PerM|uniref:AI-2E family transporter n=1 Tax=Candidatus Marifrigoribacter sp. Uisw_064 TaxID=3230970 RepID=UPI003AD94DDA